MGKKDVSYVNEELQVKFNFRVAALILNKDKILLQKSINDDFYSLVGGRVKYFEDSTTALIREVEEEIGLKIPLDKIKLIDVVENFFIYKDAKFQEILFIYKIEADSLFKDTNSFKTLDKNTQDNIWIAINELDKYEIKPTIVKSIINNTNIKHHIIKDY